MLVITGSGFVPGTTVTIAGAQATVSKTTPTTLSVTAPKTPGPLGFVPVSLKTPDGRTASNAMLFRYYSAEAQLTPASPPALIMDGTGGSRLVLGTADVRGVKKRDIVASLGGGTKTVSVLLGNGDGTFQTAIATGPGPAAYAHATADFNGDGHTDLAFVSADNTFVGLLLGGGDGTFGPVVWSTAFKNSGIASAVIAGNVFGGQDLAVAVDDSVVGIRGLGDGGFGLQVTTGLTPLPPFVGLALGDLNGDGVLDFAVIGQQPAASLVVAIGHSDGSGHGDGSFGPPHPYVPIFTPSGVAIADFDGDGHGDLATAELPVADGGAQMIVYHGTGTGDILLPPNRIPSGWMGFVGAANVAFATGDFNGDTTQDLAVASTTGLVSFLLNDGLGNFTQGPIYSLATTFGGGPLPIPISALVADDFNGDGRTDLAVGGGPSSSPAVVGVMVAR